jgi:UDP-GlcNAc:undecaprenyl-phosphate GlcNAc-1-phosphate transferase
MFELLVSFFGVFAATYLLTPLSRRFGLTDQPDQRKHHKGSIPLIGGIAMFTSTALAALVFVPPTIEMTYLLAACALLTMTGSVDDKYNLSYRLRLVIQIISGILLIWGANICLNSLGNLFGFGEISLAWLAVPVTLIAIVGMINAFNMIDGIDGLAGGLALITTLGIYYLIGSQISDGPTNILLLIIGALSSYLVLNLHIFPRWTSKIFMGDAGSMLLGFVLTAFLIRYTQPSNAVFKPITALWLVAVPLMDIIVTFVRRLKHGKNPFHPDRTHIHHILIRGGFSPRMTLIIILSFQAITTIIGVTLDNLEVDESISALGFLTLFICYMLLINRSFKVAKWLRRKR